MLNQCESKEECKVSECSDKRHDTLLHKHTSTSTSKVSDPVDPESVKCAATAGTRKCEQTPYFMRAPVKVCYQNNTSDFRFPGYRLAANILWSKFGVKIGR